MKFLTFGSRGFRIMTHRIAWRRLLVAGWMLAVSRMNHASRVSVRREEPRFYPAEADPQAAPESQAVATPAVLPNIAEDAQRRHAYHARAISLCADPPSDTVCASTVSMAVIEAYVDVIRRAQGKLTLAEIEPGMPMFEAHLEDFVLDVFRAMGASDAR